VFLLKRTQNKVNWFKFIEKYIFERRHVKLLQKKQFKNRIRQHNLTFTRVFIMNYNRVMVKIIELLQKNNIENPDKTT
jgi:hypothetical protein